MKRALLILAFVCTPVSAAVKDVASATTITLHGTGVYRITGTATVVNVKGVSDGDEVFLVPAGAFAISAIGNIAAITATATVGRPIHLVVANGVVYEVGPSSVSSLVPTSRAISTTAPLTGGGDLSADRTFAVSTATTGATGVVQLAGDLAGTGTSPTVTQARGLRETTGPTTLTMAGVADGEFLKRSGTTITSAALTGAPSTATYITQTPDATLSAEQAMSLLGTGIVKSTTGTGVLSIAVAADFPTLNQSTTGTAAALTADPTDCAANRYATAIAANGNLTCGSVSLASGVIGTLPMLSGGTDNVTAADDTTLVSNGSAWQTKALPACAASTSKLLYDTATNSFSCGSVGQTPTVLTLAGDVSTGANTTPVNLTGMTFTAAAGKVYKVDFLMGVTAAATTTGSGFGVNCTSAPQFVALSGAQQLANTGTTTRWSSIANNAIAGATSGVPTASTLAASEGSGVILANATTSNTCQFIFRSSTTAVTTAKANSTIVVTQLN